MPSLTQIPGSPAAALAQSQTTWVPVVCIGSALLMSLVAGVVLVVALTRRKSGHGRAIMLVIALGLELVGLCGLIGSTVLMWNSGVPRIPWLGSGATPVAVCTPPPCRGDEVYYCPDECPGGCGTTCATPTPSGTVEHIIQCTPPPCRGDEVYYCPDECPGGCGTTCATPTPSGTTAHTIQCTPPPCSEGEAHYCPDECPGGCEIVCATTTPTGGQAACVEAWGWFDGALRTIPGVSERIGCATAPQRELTVATQDFERGIMIWREDQRSIFVFVDGGAWVSHVDRWQEGMPELDPAFGPPPAGLIQPRRGFGLVWQENETVREAVGWALAEESLCDAAHIQPFENGMMIACTQNLVPRARIRVFVVLADGTYELFSPP